MNIYDVAKEAGVSIATISRVINGKDVVSQKTRNKVEEILKKYNYTPNEIARGLVVNSMRTVGVMTIDIRDLYYANVAYTVERELSKLGYNVILSNTGDDTEEKIKYMNSLIQKKVDGIILVGSVFKDDSLDKYIIDIAGRIPVVMINGFVDGENIYSVMCDDAFGISAVVDHLTKKGRKQPVFFQYTNSFSSRRKLDGFKAGMKLNNLPLDGNSVITVPQGLNGGIEGVKKLFENKCVFDAVICTDDLIAIGALKCLKEHGFNVPEQVAIIGFNNSVLASCCEPELTSVDSLMEDMGRYGVDIFSKVMLGEKIQAKTVIKPGLVIRKSG